MRVISAVFVAVQIIVQKQYDSNSNNLNPNCGIFLFPSHPFLSKSDTQKYLNVHLSSQLYCRFCQAWNQDLDHGISSFAVFVSSVNQGSHSWRVRNSFLQLSDFLLKATASTLWQASPKAPPAAKPGLPASGIAATCPCSLPSTNKFTCWHVLILFRNNQRYYHQSENVSQPKFPHGLPHLSSILYAGEKTGLTTRSGPPLPWGYRVLQGSILKTYPNIDLLSNAHVLFVQWKTLNRTSDNFSVFLLPK